MYGRKSGSRYAFWRQQSRKAAGLIGGAILITLAGVCILAVAESIGADPAAVEVQHG